MIGTIILLSTMLGVTFFSGLLYYNKWKPRHIASLVSSIAFMSIFAVYTHQILAPFWPSATGSSLWLASFLIIYLGGAVIAFIPFLYDGLQEKDFRRLTNLFMIWLAVGLVYTAIDNSSFGPFAVGPSSPYIGRDLCALDPVLASEDVFFGCQLQKAGVDVYSPLAGHIVYYWFSVLLIVAGLLLLGASKVEKLLFPN